MDKRHFSLEIPFIVTPILDSYPGYAAVLLIGCVRISLIDGLVLEDHEHTGYVAYTSNVDMPKSVYEEAKEARVYVGHET